MDLNDFLTNSVLQLKKDELVSLVGPDEDQYQKLFDISYSRNMPLCWRAAWLMDSVAEVHPWLAEGYIEKIWPEIPKKHPDGVTRSALRLLVRYPIPEEFQGIATDICLEWLTKESIPVAIKAYSMEMLVKIARIYPELADEFITIIQDQVHNNSAGYKARAHHVIAELGKL